MSTSCIPSSSTVLYSNIPAITQACSVGPGSPLPLLLYCHITCQLAVCMSRRVGACIPCLVYLLPSPYHLTPGLWCHPHQAVQSGLQCVWWWQAMVHVLVLEFTLEVH
jgi:hypothetical protein